MHTYLTMEDRVIMHTYLTMEDRVIMHTYLTMEDRVIMHTYLTMEERFSHCIITRRGVIITKQQSFYIRIEKLDLSSDKTWVKARLKVAKVLAFASFGLSTMILSMCVSFI